jgi:ribosomal peptide maturation radical SAM protein 1
MTALQTQEDRASGLTENVSPAQQSSMNARLEDLSDAVTRSLSPARVLLVVPPFDGLDLPSLAVHLLQACARKRGFDVSVFYANLALASLIGESNYEVLCNGPVTGLFGERFFAHLAYGKDLKTLFSPELESHYGDSPHRVKKLALPEIAALAQHAGRFVDVLARSITARNYQIVGCSSTFEQTAASVSIFNALKTKNPEITTIFGGGNCEGAMANGISLLVKSADYIFSGESEAVFPAFLDQFFRGEAPSTRIIRGEPVCDLNTLPDPEFGEYFEQMKIFLPDCTSVPEGRVWLPTESSRGCWWGEKHPCTFCGINGDEVRYRKKRPEVVFDQIVSMLERHSPRSVFMVDSIMPRDYFKTLLPKLERIPGLNLFYEQKANLTPRDVATLKASGVNLIQPGIESLSTPMLKLMNKGVTARQNINLLRNARSAELSLNWNILYDLPGDHAQYYRDMLKMLPHIIHFHPPCGLLFHSLERFSAYFQRPSDYGITNVRAMQSYYDVLPGDIDAMSIAYHFVADYDSAARRHPELVHDIRTAVATWIAAWTRTEAQPTLAVIPLDSEAVMVLDTRYEYPFTHFLSIDEAAQIMTEQRVSDSNPEDFAWALSRHLMLEVDGFYIPLATTSTEARVDLSVALAAAATQGRAIP